VLGRIDRTYAERRYREGLRTWRTAIRKPLLLVVGPVFLGSVVWGISENHPSAYLAGFITGLSGAFAVMFREYAPPYVENWGLGGRGERLTRRALRPLQRRGWTVVEDIESHRFGNYDHVAIGPAGVFLIDSKCLRGTVKIDGHIPRLYRKYDPEGRDSLLRHGRQLIAAGNELCNIIRERAGHHVLVGPVVVYWNPSRKGDSRHRTSLTYRVGSFAPTYSTGLRFSIPMHKPRSEQPSDL
jgi:hypothetical protein